MTLLRFKILVALLCSVLLLGGNIPPARARARNVSALELLETVNALRASRGLSPYIVDAGIMAYAQEHSEYQAAIHKSTHEHRDGSIPPDFGLVENVAGGDLGWITPEIAVYEIWQDPGHMKTMVGYSSGTAGVGVADDGQTEYYTLDVRPGGAVAPTESGKATPGSQVETEAIPIVSLVTVTPRSNGCTVHIVGYGQTLWAIALAYGVKVDEIRALNGIPADSTTIYEGQKLVVRCVTVTPTSQTSPTLSPPTETPSPAQAILPTISPTQVSLVTATTIQDGDPASPPGPPRTLVAGLLVLGGGTLLVVLAYSLVRRR